MPRRKKSFNFNQLVIAAVLIVATWIAADYYFNIYRHPQTETVPEEAAPPATVTDTLPSVPAAQTEPEVISADGFVTATYRDDRYGIEFQYPVYGKEDSRCPVIEKTDSGFNLGMFSLTVSVAQGALADFVDGQLEGMEIGKNENKTVAGLPAIIVDYQTKGMGWYGIDTYIDRDGKVYDFGILANATPDKCGGIDDYEDRVYQSAISTLKFTD
jgi:hypothetical protein